MLQLVVSCDEDICESQRQTNAPSDRTAKRFRPSAQGCRSAAATLGIEFESVSTPMGLRLLSFAFTQRSCDGNCGVPTRAALALGWRSQPLRGINSAIAKS